MKKMIIAGAGQMGMSVSQLLNETNIRLAAFADNSPNKWRDGDIPVVSFADAIAVNPDIILIGVLDDERASSMKEQFDALGYSGEYIFLSDIYNTYDMRSGTFRRFIPRLDGVPGAIAELGVYKGDFSLELRRQFPGRTLYLFDTFEGFNADDIKIETAGSFSQSNSGDFTDTSAEYVLGRFDDTSDIVLKKGYFPDTAAGLENEVFAFVSLDADLYAPTLAGLEFFYPRLSHGGAILLHDYGSRRFSGVFQAVADYEKKYGKLLLVPLCDLHKSCIILHP